MIRTPLKMILRRLALPALALVALPAARASADAPTHEIRKTEPKVASGGQASAGLTIAAKNGWHVNAEAPITVSLTSGDAALTLSKAKLTRADLAESTQEKARFDIPVTCAPGTAAGTKTINAEAKFVMCQESACKPVKETLALNVEITAAEAPAAKDKGAGKTKKSQSKSQSPTK
jgi:DsbC/DsbD-like thiol-disulfide interchange protein